MNIGSLLGGVAIGAMAVKGMKDKAAADKAKPLPPVVDKSTTATPQDAYADGGKVSSNKQARMLEPVMPTRDHGKNCKY